MWIRTKIVPVAWRDHLTRRAHYETFELKESIDLDEEPVVFVTPMWRDPGIVPGRSTLQVVYSDGHNGEITQEDWDKLPVIDMQIPGTVTHAGSEDSPKRKRKRKEPPLADDEVQLELFQKQENPPS